MSERKVLNKYYPPDFDPSKIPRLRLPKTRQYTVRIMTPCNMKCNTCGDYIAKAKKFNARKETVDSEVYLGLKIFRFYFKCPTCMAEITFKTDPKNCDYELEHGATRNFQALRMAEQQARKEAADKEEEEKLNPMKMLENRTKSSRREMEELEALEELRDMSQKKVTVNYEQIIEKQKKEAEAELKRQQEEDEAFVRTIFPQKPNICGLDIEDVEEEVEGQEEEAAEEDKDKDGVDVSKPRISFFGGSFEKKSSDLISEEGGKSMKKKLAQLVKIVKKPKQLEEKQLTAKVVSEAMASASTASAASSSASLGPKLGLLCGYSDSDSSD